jgi:hypothetical protein
MKGFLGVGASPPAADANAFSGRIRKGYGVRRIADSFLRMLRVSNQRIGSRKDAKAQRCCAYRAAGIR